MPTLSVIIPVYNVAPYLRACLDSVCIAVANAQKAFHDFTAEIICVDDGSTDGSGATLDEYAERFNSSNRESECVPGEEECKTTAVHLHLLSPPPPFLVFRIIHQPNAGVSAARNAALDVATGEWITFIDGDDTWEPSLCSCIFCKIATWPTVNVVAFSIRLVDCEGQPLVEYDQTISLPDAQMAGSDLLAECRGRYSRYIWSVCDKFIRTIAIKKLSLRFSVGMRLSEDSLFSQLLLAECGDVLVCPSLVGYNYYMRSSSAVHKTVSLSEYLKEPFRLGLSLLNVWMRKPSRGLKARLRHDFSGAPSLGCGRSCTDRDSCIDWLLCSDNFNKKIIPFLWWHGTVKARCFALAYMLSTISIKRFLLGRIGQGFSQVNVVDSEMLELVYTSDDNYLMPTYVSVCSAYAMASNPSRLLVHILDCGISESRWSDFECSLRRRFSHARICRHAIDMDRFGSCKAYCGSLATYARVLTAEIVGNSEWCVFVDGDVAFFDDPLKLLQYRQSDKLIIGHRDYPGEQPDEEWIAVKKHWFEENGFKWDIDQFICMGFVLMNLKAMRETCFAERCLAAFERCTPSKSADQEVMNALSQGMIAYLPDEWGAFNLLLFAHAFIPSCVHYVYSKPWSGKLSWTHCLSDAESLWLQLAQKIAGLGWNECCWSSRWLYRKRFFYALVIKCAIVVFGIVKPTNYTQAWVIRKGLFASAAMKNILNRRIKNAVRRMRKGG